MNSTIKQTAQAKYSAQESLKRRDIGAIPPVKNPERKAACEKNLKLFCETYYKHIFSLDWSDDHIKAIKKIEKTIFTGGLFALAMPRGSGKTSLLETAATWAILFGHKRFPVIIGSDETSATETLASIKIELENNELLAEDFPEICWPIAALEGIANRTRGQVIEGKRTAIIWTNKEIRLPCVDHAMGSGATLRTSGITGRIRGMKAKTPDGDSIRPDLILLDDAQTDDSARSLSQTQQRLEIISKAVLGLGGPGNKISAFAACTVIRPGDMADSLLNKEVMPEWRGERCKLIYKLPENEKLWEEYKDLLNTSYKIKGDISLATEFYKKNKKEMDVGAEPAWKERKNPDELSAIQHAMNLKFNNEAAFLSEYQNEPQADETASPTLDIEDIYEKVNGLPRGSAPHGTQYITAYIDVQKYCLYYCITAWSEGFTGSVIDYGTFPEQKDYHVYSQINKTGKPFSKIYKNLTPEACIYEAVQHLIKDFLERDFEGLKIEKIFVDSGYETDTVYKAIRNLRNPSVLPAKGLGISAKNKPISMFHKKKGSKFGHHWYIPSTHGTKEIRHINIDTNYWKTFISSRIVTHAADKGSLSFFGKKGYIHKLFAEHLTAEFPVKTFGYGRVVESWQLIPNRDNHWFDCLVGTACAASLCGMSVEGLTKKGGNKKEKDKNKKRGNRKQIKVNF